MLPEVIDLQNEAVSKLLSCVESNREVTFKAPTGSGKTYMMSDFMNRILERDSNVIFIVSTLSKGGLGEQNYKAFVRFAREGFGYLKPFLIDSNDSGEEALHIDTSYNVYVLPRDLYKEKSKLKQGALVNFLNALSPSVLKQTQGKKLYLIKDECHIKTNNLDSLIMDSNGKGYFQKVINISATPKIAKGQTPNVEITESQAISANLIKKVELKGVDNESSIEELQGAIKEFIGLKKAYLDEQNGVGINPCLIIQISNKDKADKEIQIIKEALKAHSELKYMIIVDNSDRKKSSKCESNDKVAKLPIKKWKDYAKGNNSSIDIIVFKMVISEGWDIPRACMLYQMRDSQSTQLDEQVMGRVRRNPRLLDFETLSEAQRELISKAYIYGVKPKESSTRRVWLKGEINKGLFENEIIKEFSIKITRLKSGERLEFSAEKFLADLGDFGGDDFGGDMRGEVGGDSSDFVSGNVGGNLIGNVRGKKDIFTLYRELELVPELEAQCKAYAGSESHKWYAFANNFGAIKKEYEKEVIDYDKSVEICDEVGALAMESFFSAGANSTDLEFLEEWAWQKEGDSFCFDSKAEIEWIKIISKCGRKGLIKSITINDNETALFGKNYPYNSGIKFEYYLNGRHFSYPDFVLKDTIERIHIFEVKSVDSFGSGDSDYTRKITELEKIYKAISKKEGMRGYHFWIPIKQEGNRWVVKCYANGEDRFSGEAFGSEEIINAVAGRLRG